MLRARSLALGFALFALAPPASAQTPDAPPQAAPPQAAPPQAAPMQAPPPQAAPPPQYPQPQAYPQQPYPQAAPGVYGQPPQQAYPPGYTPPPPVYSQPNYPQQGYPPGYGYATEPPPPPKPESLRWSLRFDPFELVMRQLSFQGEVYVAGPFAIEVAPSWIFGSPYSGIDKKGVSVAANAVFYLSMMGLRGMWLKAHFAYENYAVQLTDEAGGTSTKERLSSAILGAMFGDTFVIPRSGGFALSAGIGVGAATAPKKTLTTSNGVTATLYDGFDKVRLLGSLGLGVAF
jgi:hypothetical protein